MSNPPKKSMTPTDRVYLNLSIDHFIPDPMVFNSDDGTYSLDRMVPAIEMEYFFTINGSQKYLMTKTKRPPYDNDIDLVFVNVMKSKVKNKKKITKECPTLEWQPRPIRPDWPDVDNNKTPEWDFKKSIFYGYRFDNEDLIKKWFDYDWKHCKIPNLIKNHDELSKIQKYLKSIYKPLREVYKYYAGVSPCSNVPSISRNAFDEIIALTNVTETNDVKDLKLSDIDLEFTATKSGTKKNKLNPDKWWLVRYQLMEICVRIALK